MMHESLWGRVALGGWHAGWKSEASFARVYVLPSGGAGAGGGWMAGCGLRVTEDAAL